MRNGWTYLMPELGNQLPLPRCPHCAVAKPFLARAWEFETKDYRGSKNRWWNTFVCRTCGGVVLCASNNGNQGGIVEQYPAGEKFDDSSIPERARAYLNQAIESVHAPAGAIMLAASAVDAMLKAKKYTDGSLYSRIDKAAADHVITTDMGMWAHEVRLDANDQRHADQEALLPTEAEARRAIEFVKALALFMFILPSRVKVGLAEAKGGTAPAKVSQPAKQAIS